MPTHEHSDLHFKLRLLFRHPHAEPSIITDTLTLPPTHCWTAGDPIGTGGNNRAFSAWTYAHEVRGKRAFAESLDEILTLLQVDEGFLSDLPGKGWDGQLILNLAGNANIGDTISPETLQKLVSMRLGLGIEVFAHME